MSAQSLEKQVFDTAGSLMGNDKLSTSTFNFESLKEFVHLGLLFSSYCRGFPEYVVIYYAFHCRVTYTVFFKKKKKV